MNSAILPFPDPAFEHGCRALQLENIIGGEGRKRLRAARPARVLRNRWEIERKGTWHRMVDWPLPEAIQMPDGTVREIGSGLLFDSRLSFLTARRAA